MPPEKIQEIEDAHMPDLIDGLDSYHPDRAQLFFNPISRPGEGFVLCTSVTAKVAGQTVVGRLFWTLYGNEPYTAKFILSKIKEWKPFPDGVLMARRIDLE